ncbi:MAG: hypothetical protein OHK0029_24880 [Armatimonadaceae bacterium]
MSISQIPFRRATGTQRVPALSHAEVFVSSEALHWEGLYLESGRNKGWVVDDLTVDGHYVALNLAEEALEFQQLVQRTWLPVRMAPGTFWINPEGQPFSLRVKMTAHWVGVVIGGAFLDKVLGGHHELRGGYGIEDTQLAYLQWALLEEAANGGKTGAPFAQALIQAFCMALGKRHGTAAPELPARGGIAPDELQRLMRWIEAHLGDEVTVEDLASEVSLSVAHFSREFKRSTGETPWGYVVGRRLERARSQLLAGYAASQVAVDCGFSDQAHLSRLFKQHYGTTPGAFRRLQSTAR